MIKEMGVDGDGLLEIFEKEGYTTTCKKWKHHEVPSLLFSINQTHKQSHHQHLSSKKLYPIILYHCHVMLPSSFAPINVHNENEFSFLT